MGGHAANPHHQISSSDDRRGGGRIHFPVGSSVEVRTDENGLEGVNFSATVLPPPPLPPSSTTAISPGKKSGNLLFVEYDNLLADDGGTERLREHVDAAFVRPAPPQLVFKGFQQDDVVDAFYMDGWSTGVVSRAVEGGERVAVMFQSPQHELEFGPGELRPHWDWADGIWVKKQSTRFVSSMFDLGKFVEVLLDDEEYYRDAWIPATIEQDFGNGVFVVGYDIGWNVREQVDSHNIRPGPALLVDDKKEFVLLEKVDAYYDYGWWSGVITKVLENRRYEVMFKQMKQVKEFEQWELRPHMEWKDGKWWLQPCSDDDGVGDQNYGTEKSVVNGKLRSRKQLTLHYNQNILSSTKRRRQCELKEGNAVEHDKTVQQVQSCSVNNVETSAAGKQKSKQNVVELKIKRMSPKGLQEEMQQYSSSLIDGEKQGDGVVVEDEGCVMQVAPALVDQGCTEPNEPQILLPCVGKTVGVELQSESETKVAFDLVDECCMTPIELKSSPCVENSVGFLLLDNDSEKQESETKSGVDVANSALVGKCCIESSETQRLPSVNNTTSLGRIVESMEVFKRIPQKPHFQPLQQFKEGLREGLTIGYMVSFACLVEKTCRLQFDDPKSIIDDIIETLAELESHGFDVSFVQDRLTKLLRMKEEEGKLVDEVKDFKKRISEQNHEKTMIEGEIGEMKEKMRKLQEKLSVADDEIASLQSGLKETEESIKTVKCDFEGVVSSIL